MKNKMRIWHLICSIDADNIDYEEDIVSDTEPDYWTCYNIAISHNCEYFEIIETETACE